MMTQEREPAANQEKPTEQPEPLSDDREDEKKRDSRLAMTLREAEIIAQNLKESGTRR